MCWSGLRSKGETTSDVVDKVTSAALVGGMGKRSPHEATCPRIASGFSEKDAACPPFTQHYSKKFSGLALQVCGVLCRFAAPRMPIQPAAFQAARHLPIIAD